MANNKKNMVDPHKSKPGDHDSGVDAIGRKIRQKEAISDVNYNEVKDAPKPKITPREKQDVSAEDQIKHVLNFTAKTKDIGFNCLCELNLGKAYKYEIFLDGEQYFLMSDAQAALEEKLNNDPSFSGKIIEKRSEYDANYKKALNEVWLDYQLEQIKNARNAIVVISDIFTPLTTGNFTENLPYEEQLNYIKHKLNDKRLKDKIIVLVRGQREQEIMRYQTDKDLDLMKKLGEFLGMPERVVNGGFVLNVTVSNGENSEPQDVIKFAHYEGKINSRKPAKVALENFADKNSGKDVYFCTNARFNSYSPGAHVYTDEEGVKHTKNRWFVCFGGCYEWDKKNEKYPQLGPYTLNKWWHKISVTPDKNVIVTHNDYAFPLDKKRDTSSFVSAVAAEEYENSISVLIDEGIKKLNELKVLSTDEFRVGINDTLKECKNRKKEKENVANIVENKVLLGGIENDK